MNTTAIPVGTLLADDACTATWMGTCAICHHPITIGQRIARLVVMTSGWAHTSCTPAIAAVRPPKRADRTP